MRRLAIRRFSDVNEPRQSRVRWLCSGGLNLSRYAVSLRGDGGTDVAVHAYYALCWQSELSMTRFGIAVPDWMIWRDKNARDRRNVASCATRLPDFEG